MSHALLIRVGTLYSSLLFLIYRYDLNQTQIDNNIACAILGFILLLFRVCRYEGGGVVSIEALKNGVDMYIHIIYLKSK